MTSTRSNTEASEGTRAVGRRHEVSAGGVVWRRNPEDGSLEVVLVRPAGKETWGLPKGHLKTGESVVEAALRETREESGLDVGSPEPLGEISYVYSSHKNPGGSPVRIFKRVHFFLMRFIGGDASGHDKEIAEVRWVKLEHAAEQASYQGEREMLAQARARLARGPA